MLQNLKFEIFTLMQQFIFKNILPTNTSCIVFILVIQQDILFIPFAVAVFREPCRQQLQGKATVLSDAENEIYKRNSHRKNSSLKS